jgi:hypothetical protein
LKCLCQARKVGYRMKPRKHIHVKYCWQAYFNSIGTLSQTFKNHIHNNCSGRLRICPHISVFAPVFNFRYLRSDLKDYMSKYKERWCIKIYEGWYQGSYGKFHVIIFLSHILHWPFPSIDYHMFCCNMFVFACPIIDRSQCWLFALRANNQHWLLAIIGHAKTNILQQNMW